MHQLTAIHRKLRDASARAIAVHRAIKKLETNIVTDLRMLADETLNTIATLDNLTEQIGDELANEDAA